MAITLVQDDIATKNEVDAPTTCAFGSNVTSGNKVVVLFLTYRNTPTFLTAGMCTKSAGTATIGSVTLERTDDYSGYQNYQTAIWSAQVTGSGSLTMAVAQDGADYAIMVVEEWSGIAESDYVIGVNSGEGASGGPVTGTVASTESCVFVAVVGQHGATSSQVQDAAFTANYINQNMGGITLCTMYRIADSVTDQGELTAPTNLAWTACLAVYRAATGGGPAAGSIVSTITL